MRLLKELFAVCLFMVCVTANALDIQCNYDFNRTREFNEFVKKEVAKNPDVADFYKKYKWWEFWNKRVIYLSIDLKSKKVTGGLHGDTFNSSRDTYTDIYPDSIMITQEIVDDKNRHNKILVKQLDINRLDGSFFGMQYVTLPYDPTKNKNSAQYSIYGSCKYIKRKF